MFLFFTVSVSLLARSVLLNYFPCLHALSNFLGSNILPSFCRYLHFHCSYPPTLFVFGVYTEKGESYSQWLVLV